MITIRDGAKLTKKQAELIDAMNRELESGRWEWVPGKPYVCIRYSEAFAHDPDRFCPWDSYERHVFLNVVTGKPWSILLDDNNPFNSSAGQHISMAKALEVLANPRSVWGY